MLSTKFDKAAKITAVLTGLIIPLSVSGISILMNVTSLLSILAGAWREKIRNLLNNSVFRVALLLFILFVVTIPYTAAPAKDAWQYVWKYSKLLYLIFLMPLFVKEKQKRYGIQAFLVAMAVTVGASFLKRMGLLQLGVPGAWDTLFTNHINVGLLIAFASFIALHRCFINNRWRWIYCLFFLSLMFFLFFLNAGRTGYIISLALLSLFLWQKLRWRGLSMACVFIPIFLMTVYVASATFRHHLGMIATDMQNYHRSELHDNSLGLRWQFAKHSLILIKERPLVGQGVGSFRSLYRKQFPPDPGFANMAHPQNEYLLITEQLGLLGLAVFLWLLVAEWRASWKLSEEFKYYAQGLVLAFAIGCLCDSFLFLMIPGYFFIYFSALFFAGIGHVARTE